MHIDKQIDERERERETHMGSRFKIAGHKLVLGIFNLNPGSKHVETFFREINS